ncbi:MAG: hypothetical protein LBI06_02295 [Treponema sp.]|jgi:hypothetical protein|nr:hypothetical protein [Treponema sp.]
MNCIEHDDRNAVAQCAQCGAGICKECEANTNFRIDNKALCRRCDYNVACENDRLFKSGLKTKQIVLIVNAVTCSVGLIGLFIATNGLVFLLIAWFVGGLVANILGRVGMTSLKEKTTFGMKIAGFIGELIGTALACPIIIIMGLIGMYRVKKQIAGNDAILSRFGGENTQ